MKEKAIGSTRRQFLAEPSPWRAPSSLRAEAIRATYRLQHVLLGPVVFHSLPVHFQATGPAEIAPT